jgi:hypothetical protein
MDFSAAHSDVVIISYILTGLCLIGLALYLVLRDRKLAKKLKDLGRD